MIFAHGICIIERIDVNNDKIHPHGSRSDLPNSPFGFVSYQGHILIAGVPMGISKTPVCFGKNENCFLNGFR